MKISLTSFPKKFWNSAIAVYALRQKGVRRLNKQVWNVRVRDVGNGHNAMPPDSKSKKRKGRGGSDAASLHQESHAHIIISPPFMEPERRAHTRRPSFIPKPCTAYGAHCESSLITAMVSRRRLERKSTESGTKERKTAQPIKKVPGGFHALVVEANSQGVSCQLGVSFDLASF